MRGPILLLLLALAADPTPCFSAEEASSTTESCIRDPNAKALQAEWKKFFDLRSKKARVNIKALAANVRLDSDTLKLLQSVSEVEGLIGILDELEKLYLKTAFIDRRFNDVVSSPNFIAKLESRELDGEVRASELKFKDDPHLYELLDQARAQVSRQEVKDALEVFTLLDLGVLEARYRASAKLALKHIRKIAGDIEGVRAWIVHPPLMKDVPILPASIGPFATKYRWLLQQEIARFVLERPVTLAEAKKVFPKIKQTELDALNAAQPPTEKNSFDEYISKISSDEITSAVEGVTRTLWGEASSCQLHGLPQFEAIGRIIADRAMAVCRARDELHSLDIKKAEVREENWKTFLTNWTGIGRRASGHSGHSEMKAAPQMKLRGLADFGRPEKAEIQCAAQVISKKYQFSVWNSFTLKRFHSGAAHKNIPDAVYEIQGPQAENDDRALVRILCPEFQNDKQRELWKHARDLAWEIVKTPEVLASRIKWPISGKILFYTHDAELPFAREVQATHLVIDKDKATLRKPGTGACNRFRLFVPRKNYPY